MLLTQLVHGVLFPPGVLLLLLALGLGLHATRPRLARAVLLIATLSLFAVTNPALVGSLRAASEWRVPIRAADLAEAQAIVILGGGQRRAAPEYGDRAQVSTHGLLRARYGAHLRRETGLPILVTGGAVRGEPDSEAGLMARLIEDEFGVDVRWRETRSRTTYENALYSAELLRAEGLDRIALVTSALHLPRAVEAFERQGLRVFPAPTDIKAEPGPESRWLDYVLPNAGALREFSMVLHEWVGRFWYRLRHY